MSRAGRWLFRRSPLVVAILIVVVVVVIVTRPGSHALVPGTELVAGPNPGFTLTGSVSNLTPNVSTNLVLSANNLLDVPITVSSVMVSATSTAPSDCLPNLTLNGHGFPTSPASLTVPVSPTVTVGASGSGLSGSPPDPANITLPNLLLTLSSGAGNDCQSVTFNFQYSATGTFTEPTTTSVTSAPNPSNSGQSVTFTATVTGTDGDTPVGTVTFYKCANNPAVGSSCTSPTALNSTPATVNSSGQATYSTSSLLVGSTSVYAAFTPTDSQSYATSNSTTITQVVQAVQPSSCVNISTTSTSGQPVTTITGTQSGDYEVKNGTTLYLHGGTITGNLTVDGTGDLIADNGATIKGNLTSSGGPVSLQGGTSVGGNLQVKGPLALGAGTTVTGSTQITGTGVTALCSLGSSSVAVTLKSGLQIQQLPPSTSSSTPVMICNTNVTGAVTYQNNGLPAIFGGSSSCLGNTFAGNFSVQNNTAQLTIGATGYGNTTTGNGNITVSNNSGSSTSTLINNKAGAACTLNNDSPGIAGSANTATGQNTCDPTTNLGKA